LAFRRADRTATVGEFVRCFGPKSFVRRHAVWIAAAVAIGVAATFMTGLDYYRSYVENDVADPEFVQRHVDMTAAQKKQVTEYLAEADDDLKKYVNPNSSPEELTYFLSDAANSVREIVQAALVIDPGNKAALKINAEIARLYTQKARALLDSGRTGAADVALALVRKGRDVMPADRDLKRLFRDICKRDPLPQGCTIDNVP
jgi:hypothetical protein